MPDFLAQPTWIGILSLREKTMTFANIQNIEIRRNPLQRLLGIADVQVRTAGGGGGAAESGHIGESLHQASFRGVDDPEMIRTTIAERVRLHRGSGLGDPDDAPDARQIWHGRDRRADRRNPGHGLRLADADLERKLVANCEPIIGRDKCARLLEAVWSFDRLDNLALLYRW